MSLHRLLPLSGLLMLAGLASCDTAPEATPAPASAYERVLVDEADEVCYDLLAGQTMDAGDVCVRVVDDTLEVAYLVHDGWTILETHAWLGADLADLPTNRPGNPVPGWFPWASGWLDGADAWSFTVPLADLGIDDPEACDPSTWYLAAHAALEYYDEDADEYYDETGWAEGERITERGNWGTYTSFTLTCEPDECTQTMLYATENNHPAIDQYEMEARIWSIDATAGTAAMVDDQLAPVNGDPSDQNSAITDNFNGNAWDPDTGRFYFSDYQRLGPAGGNPLPSPLYFNDLAGNQVYAGQLVGSAAGATIHEGVYWYISQRTDDLRAVTFLPDGTVDEDVHVADLLDNTDTLGFGDIAVDVDGTAYLSATRISDFTVLFGSFDLDAATGLAVIETGALYGAGGTQIAFGTDGVLYGVNARTPYELFTIDPASGDTTFLAEMPVAYSDLATGPCAY